MSTIDTIRAGSARRRLEAPELFRSKTGVTTGFLAWLGKALTKRRTRIHLSELTDDQLRDIGLSKSDARRETKRFLWD